MTVPRSHQRRGPVVVRQARQPRRERPSRHRPRRLADVDLRGASRPGTTPPPCAPMTRSCRRWWSGRPTACQSLPTWVTKANATPSPSRSKKPKGGQLTDEQKAHNKAHNGKRPSGARELPAQDHAQGPAQRQPLPMEDREDHRRRPRDPPHRVQPDHLTTQSYERLHGKDQSQPARTDKGPTKTNCID